MVQSITSASSHDRGCNGRYVILRGNLNCQKRLFMLRCSSTGFPCCFSDVWCHSLTGISFIQTRVGEFLEQLNGKPMPFHFVSVDFEWNLFYDDNISVSVESGILDKRHSGCFWLNLFFVLSGIISVMSSDTQNNDQRLSPSSQQGSHGVMTDR